METTNAATRRLDPTEKAIRREARMMATYATRHHSEHSAADGFCHKCQTNQAARYLGVAEPYPVV